MSNRRTTPARTDRFTRTKSVHLPGHRTGVRQGCGPFGNRSVHLVFGQLSGPVLRGLRGGAGVEICTRCQKPALRVSVFGDAASSSAARISTFFSCRAHLNILLGLAGVHVLPGVRLLLKVPVALQGNLNFTRWCGF